MWIFCLRTWLARARTRHIFIKLPGLMFPGDLGSGKTEECLGCRCFLAEGNAEREESEAPLTEEDKAILEKTLRDLK